MVICMASSRCGTRFEPHLHVPVTMHMHSSAGMVAYMQSRAFEAIFTVARLWR